MRSVSLPAGRSPWSAWPITTASVPHRAYGLAGNDEPIGLLATAESPGGVSSGCRPRPDVSHGTLAIDPAVAQGRAQPVSRRSVKSRVPKGHKTAARPNDMPESRWRWRGQPGAHWLIRAARRGDGGLRGFIVFGVEESRYGRRGQIVDLLARDPSAMRALLCDAVDTLTAQGYLRVICDYLDPRPWARWALYRSGFLPCSGDFNVICGSLSAKAGAVPERLKAWYLTRGDTDLA